MTAPRMRRHEENDFMRAAMEYAELLGYLWTHTPNSMYRLLSGTKGAPDNFLLHPSTGVFFWAEMKTDRGRQSAEQQRWELALHAAGQHYYLWRPRDWRAGTVQHVLERGAGRKAA